VGTGGSFPWCKVDGPRNWPLTFIWCSV